MKKEIQYVKNPCYKCEHAFIYKGKHMQSYFKAECKECIKYAKHNEYLLSKRKYIKGESITTLEELLKQEYVMWWGATKHIEAIKSQTVRALLGLISRGAFSYAIRKN